MRIIDSLKIMVIKVVTINCTIYINTVAVVNLEIKNIYYLKIFITVVSMRAYSKQYLCDFRFCFKLCESNN